MKNNKLPILLKFFIVIILMIVVSWCAVMLLLLVHFWNDIMPVTKKDFSNYEAYSELLAESPSYATSIFVDEIPATAVDLEYYWERWLSKKLTAYSMVLSEEDYHKLIEDRLKFYEEDTSVIYLYEKDSIYSIVDSELYKAELAYIKEVLHERKLEQNYYFLVINKFKTVDGICYNGVIINDETREIIEFSAQIMQESPR